MEPLSSFAAMPSLCVFSEQDDARIGWPDRIAAYSLMDLETCQTYFDVQL